MLINSWAWIRLVYSIAKRESYRALSSQVWFHTMKYVSCKWNIFPNSLHINTLISKVPHHKPRGKLPKTWQLGWRLLGPFFSLIHWLFPCASQTVWIIMLNWELFNTVCKGWLKSHAASWVSFVAKFGPSAEFQMSGVFTNVSPEKDRSPKVLW